MQRIREHIDVRARADFPREDAAVVLEDVGESGRGGTLSTSARVHRRQYALSPRSRYSADAVILRSPVHERRLVTTCSSASPGELRDGFGQLVAAWEIFTEDGLPNSR